MWVNGVCALWWSGDLSSVCSCLSSKWPQGYRLQYPHYSEQYQVTINRRWMDDGWMEARRHRRENREKTSGFISEDHFLSETQHRWRTYGKSCRVDTDPQVWTFYLPSHFQSEQISPTSAAWAQRLLSPHMLLHPFTVTNDCNQTWLSGWGSGYICLNQ